jgi:hypothetical protein
MPTLCFPKYSVTGTKAIPRHDNLRSFAQARLKLEVAKMVIEKCLLGYRNLKLLIVSLCCLVSSVLEKGEFDLKMISD